MATSLIQEKLERVVSAGAVAVVPSNTVDLVDTAHGGLYVTATGNIVFHDFFGNTVTLTAVPAFTRIPIVASRVLATGTTATVLALV